MKVFKKMLKIIGFILLFLVIVVVVYVIYVVASYHRIEDHVQLTTSKSLTEAAAETVVPTKTSLSIVTANIGFGAYSQDYDFFMDGGTQSWAFSKEAVLENVGNEMAAIAGENADYVLLQEVDTDSTRSYHVDQYELAREALPSYESVLCNDYDSPFLFYPLTQPHGKSVSNLAVFARTGQITSTERRSLPVASGFSKFLDLDRCYTVSRLPVDDGRELILINIHPSAYGADASIQDAQMATLFEDMQKEYAAGNYVIVGGDFNHDMSGDSANRYGNTASETESWAVSFPFDQLPEGFTVEAKALADAGTLDCAATCRDTSRPYDGTNDRWILDGFIISDNVTMETYDTLDLDFKWSDHNPVKMTFTLNGKEE